MTNFTLKHNLLKYLILLIALITTVSAIFLHVHNVKSTSSLPWDIDVTIKYGDKQWNYRLADYIGELNKTQINNRAVYQSFDGKLRLFDSLMSQGYSAPQAYSYVMYNLYPIVREIEKTVNKNMQQSSIKFNAKGGEVFSYVQGKEGVTVNVYGLCHKVLMCCGKGHCNVDVPIKTVKPDSIEQLKKQTALIGKFTTTFSTANSSRTHNIKLAVKSINGTIINAGQSFSFNQIVGERTTKRGYKNAKVIQNGIYVDGVGGGVCQVSTTLYNAVLLAGLNVQRVAPHTLQPSYCKAGFDAMVADKSSDFVFINNTTNKVYIKGYVEGNSVTFELYGLEQVGIKRVRESVETERIPFTQKVIFDRKNYPDIIFTDQMKILVKGSDLVKCQAYLLTYNNGKLIDRKLLRTVTYKMKEQLIVKGQTERPSVQDNSNDRQQVQN